MSASPTKSDMTNHNEQSQTDKAILKIIDGFKAGVVLIIGFILLTQLTIYYPPAPYGISYRLIKNLPEICAILGMMLMFRIFIYWIFDLLAPLAVQIVKKRRKNRLTNLEKCKIATGVVIYFTAYAICSYLTILLLDHSVSRTHPTDSQMIIFHAFNILINLLNAHLVQAYLKHVWNTLTAVFKIDLAEENAAYKRIIDNDYK